MTLLVLSNMQCGRTLVGSHVLVLMVKRISLLVKLIQRFLCRRNWCVSWWGRLL